MGKRPINQVSAKSVKKARIDPALDPIIESIRQAEDLPERCRAMLVDALPLSLMVPHDKRHEIQSAVVDMVKQTLNAKRSTMESTMAAEDIKIRSLEASRADLFKAVEEAEAALASKRNALQSTKILLADATVAAHASLQSLDERRAEHKASSDKVADAQAEKTALETALQEHFEPMKEAAAGEHFKELEPHLKHLDIEASLLIALPSVSTKPKEERGSFDTVVLEELGKALSAKVASLAEIVATETPLSANRETAMLAAQEEYDAKKDTQKRAAADFEASKKDEGEGEAMLLKAKEKVNELQPGIDAATQLLEVAKKSLDTFDTDVLAQFSAYSAAVSPAEAAPLLGA